MSVSRMKKVGKLQFRLGTLLLLPLLVALCFRLYQQRDWEREVFEAITHRQLTRLQLALQQEPQAGIRNWRIKGDTPIGYAVRCEFPEGVKSLIELSGADASSRYPRPLVLSALGCRSRASRNSLLSLLVSHGADVNAQEHGSTALHFAALADELSTVKQLIQLGADPNATNQEGLTPLGILRQRKRYFEEEGETPYFSDEIIKYLAERTN